MSDYGFRPAKRESIPLLIGIAGGTGAGKTMSALRIARGLADGQPFAGIDTENRRMNHYADRFPELQIKQIAHPFRPEKYTAAVEEGVAFLEQHGVDYGHRVIVVDSMSHEWAGDGGCLDWADEITGGDPKKKPVAWATVKPAHKRMVTRLLQIGAHVIVCLRAEEKMDIVLADGQIKFVPKQTLPGGSLDGWVPITEKNFPFEMTASFLVMADAPGVPRPIKLNEDHRPFVPLDRPLDESVGRALAEWAAGGSAPPPESPVDLDVERDELVKTLLGRYDDEDKKASARELIDANRLEHVGDLAAHVDWLRRQVARVPVGAS